MTLSELERHDEEIDVYDNVVARFGDALEPALPESVANVLVDKA